MCFKLILLMGVLFLAACTEESSVPQEELIQGQKVNSTHFFEKITGNQKVSGQMSWDRFFNTSDYVYGKEPTPILKRNISKIKKGNALVLAVGEGRDGVYLARQGFRVTGVDISEVALKKAQRLAQEFNVKLNLIQGNLSEYKIQPDAYDLIVNVIYYRKELIPDIKAGLKKNGSVVFMNYTEDYVEKPGGLSVPARFLVKKGELKNEFSDFRIIEYNELNNEKDARVELYADKL